MTEIYVDADACPVKSEITRVAERHNLVVHVVSNSGMRIERNPLIRQVVVAEGPDEADNWIADNITASDIAVTADIPLADRCLKKDAHVIGPTGKPFTQASIGMALAMRNLMSDLRETSDLKSYNKAFSKRDRSDFLQALEHAIQEIRRKG
jgi:uncharacterized protein